MLGTAMSQTIYSDYQDGVIWVKLKDNYTQTRSIDINKGRTASGWSLADMPFGNDMGAYNVTSFNQPFNHIADLRLKNVVRIEFSNYAAVDQMIEAIGGSSMVEYAEKAPLIKRTLTLMILVLMDQLNGDSIKFRHNLPGM